MKALVVEGDARLRTELESAMRAEGHDTRGATDGRGARDAFARHAPELVLCDAATRGLDGLAFITLCRSCEPRALVIMMGPWAADARALACIRAGAFDYIPKPFRTDHVILVVRKAIEQEGLRTEVQRLRDALQWAKVAAAPVTPEVPDAPIPQAQSSPAAATEEDLSVKRRTATLERTLIRRALARTGGNRTRAARLLELSHRALLYKIREYGLQS